MQKYRICIVTHVYPSCEADYYRGGFVSDLAKSLLKRGHSIHIVTPMLPGALKNEVVNGVQIHRFTYKGWKDGVPLGQLKGVPILLLTSFVISGIFNSIKVSHRHKADIFHAYWVVPGGFIAMICGLLTGKPVVATAAGSDLNIAPHNIILRTLISITLRFIDRLIAVSTPMKNIAVRLGMSDAKGVVIPGPVGIDFSEYCIKPDIEKTINHKPLCIEKKLIYVGNMTPPKRVDTILKAVAKLSRSFDNFKLILAGEGELRSDLESLASDLGLGQKVCFMGALPHRQVLELLSEADLFVHCSENEGLPVAIMEAMASGLPVVASSVGGIPELVHENETGFVVHYDDSDAYADRILSILQDSEMLSSFGKKGRSFAESTLDREKIISENEKIYKKLKGTKLKGSGLHS